MDNDKCNKKDVKKIVKEDESMTASTKNNYVYRITTDKNSSKQEPVVSKKVLEDAKKVFSKYKMK